MQLLTGAGGIDFDFLTIDEAVIKFFDERVPYEEHASGEIDFWDPAAECLRDLLIKKVVVDRAKYLVSFFGFYQRRPFNAGDIWKIPFPDLAYYRFWEADDEDHHGLEEPYWIEELRAKYKPQTEPEGLPSWDRPDSDEPLPELPAELTGGEELMDNEEPTAAASVTKAESEALAILKMKKYQPLADVIEALAEFEAMPEGGIQKKSEETLRAKIDRLANKHEWGKGDKNKLSDNQWKGLKSVIMPGTPGRKPKENGENDLNCSEFK